MTAFQRHALAVIGISQSGVTVILLPQEHWVCVYLVCVAGMWKYVGIARKLPDDLEFPLVAAVLNALVCAVARNVISLNMHLVVPSWVVFVHDVRLLLNVLDVFLAVWYLRA